MTYKLIPASEEDRTWIDELRRSVYADLFEVSFGGWDEARHQRHCASCWERGDISIVEVRGSRVGMIQLLDQQGTIEIGEIQVQPTTQNKGLGTHLLEDVIRSARGTDREVALSVGLKNVGARRLYERIGFVQTGSNASHVHLRWTPE